MPEPLPPDALAPEYADVLTTQEYSRKTPIEGVRVLPLNLLTDDGGSFASWCALMRAAIC